MEYLDFDIEVGPGHAESYPAAVLNSPAGQAQATLDWPFKAQELESYLQQLQFALFASDAIRRKAARAMQKFGQRLFDALFVDDLRGCYDVSRMLAGQKNAGLRLRLRISPSELAVVPWEYLYDSRLGEYLCLIKQTPLVRYLALPQPIQPLKVRQPLRILGMIASPKDQPALHIQREQAYLEEAIRNLIAEGLVELTWLSGQTWRDLHQAMQGGPWHIFHFIGHGTSDPSSGDGVLMLAKETGETDLQSAQQIGRLLGDHHSLRFIVLNACQGAQSDTQELFSGTATTLARRGIPAVLAMQYKITNSAAIELTRSLYAALAGGLPVDEAVTEARKAISFSTANSLEWGTPVLYMRSPDGVLFDLPKPISQSQPQQKQSAARKDKPTKQHPPLRVATSQRYIVGRQAEVQLFDNLLADRADYWLLNIYGPGGIGKSIVSEKLVAHANALQVPVALVDGGHYPNSNLTPDRILFGFKQAFLDGPLGEQLAEALDAFDIEFRDYLIINQILERGGGIQALFDVLGNIKDPTGFAAILTGLGQVLSESVQRTVRNRFALDRYLRGAERALTLSFVNAVGTAQEDIGKPLVFLLDTYEEMEQLDHWVCRTLIPALPPGIRMVILGRNQLFNVNFDWRDKADIVSPLSLPELPEQDAKRYLHHYGLADPIALEHIYAFTGGYPLLLVLVQLLARQAGGWEAIGTLERSGDRDFIATQLLERILREERVQEVRAFLERGAVATWFDPEVISVVMDVSPEQARGIYDKIQRHSFVERHPFGFRFHDKIRELLRERLKFTSEAEYLRLNNKLMAFYAAKAGPLAFSAKGGLVKSDTSHLSTDTTT